MSKEVSDVRETSLLPEADLQVDLRVGRCSVSGRAAVLLFAGGIPATASLATVIASILGSLQVALGARLEEKDWPLPSSVAMP